jgi:bacillolysin
MKFSFVLSIVVVLSQLILPQSPGIKTAEQSSRFFKHDHIKGFELLQKGVSNQIYAEYSHANSTPSVVAGGLTSAGYCSKNSPLPDVHRFFREHKELFGIQNPESELRIISSFQDNIAMTHLKLQQYINNIRIVSSEVVVHINNDGSIESVNGNYIPTPLIEIDPKLSSSDALVYARNYLGVYTSLEEYSELTFFRKDITLIPAYEIKLPSKEYPKMVLYINASDGSLIYKDNGIRYDGPAIGTGVSLNGSVKQINTYLSGGKYYLLDASLPMYSPPLSNLNGLILTYDIKNAESGSFELVSDPNNDNNFNDNLSLRAAVDAHVYTQQVYKFYKNNYNRNSFDGLGGSLKNIVHYGQSYNNAFWNGEYLVYGDGDDVIFSNFAGALDIICHEITHGVISSTANLNYVSQSGALNESFADVFAVLLDSTDWLIGEDVFTPGISGDALRSLQNPHNGQPAGSNFWQPAHMSEFIFLPETEDSDYGGVHINSGIPNKAFYNVASAIGRWKAGQIWYRTLTAYLTSNSQFRDMRICALLAAKDLYGLNSTEYNAVISGFDAVGVYANTPSAYTLAYDDGNPDTGLYENLPSWRLAYKFSLPSSTVKIDEVSIYLSGVSSGIGKFTLELFDQNNSGLPGRSLITPYTYTTMNPYGWHSFTITGLTVSTDFFVSVLYDGINWPNIGADPPPGVGRIFEYDPSQNLWYRLTGDFDYTLFMRARVSSVITSLEIETLVPEEFLVSESFPNPFNPSTSIRYSLPNAENVIIVVYDVTGRRVAELINNYHNPGTYTVSWNGKSNEGISVSSGIYYCRIEAGEYSAIKKMILMK